MKATVSGVFEDLDVKKNPESPSIGIPASYNLPFLQQKVDMK